MDIAIMIEGQDGLTWPRWQRLARSVEALGFAGLYRSDHFTNPNPPDKESLELWVSLTWLASHTSRIEFGQLVSPVSFRDPVMLARQALAIDDLAGGRMALGIGAGWQEREHQMFGYPLLDQPARMARFAEAVAVTAQLLRSDTPIDFSGEYYQLREAWLLPRPQRPGGPPLVIGGNGERRTMPLAAQYADEWNGVYLTPDGFRQRTAHLDQLLDGLGRERSAVRRTLMHGIVFGRSAAAVAAQASEWQRSPDELRARGVLVGTPDELPAQIAQYAAAGVQRLMLQWLQLDDLDGLEALAKAVL